ncbi:MAG: MFS transporter [Planctomycetota bacterium]
MPRPKGMLLSLFSIIIIDLIGFGIVLPVLPFYASEYNASGLMLGFILGGYSGMQFIFSPVWGRLSDRIGRRPVMLVTILGTSLALLALGLVHSYLGLLLARLAAGCFGANIAVATAYIADVTDESERTRWMGMVGASFAIGFVLGPAIGGFLSPFGLAVPMLVAGGMAAANCVHAFFVLREPVRHGKREQAGRSRLSVLKDSFVLRICVVYLLFSMAVCQLETIFAYFMKDRFDYSAREVAYILVFMALIMGGIQGGALRRLAPRFGERRLLLSGLTLMMLGFLAAPQFGMVALMLVPLGVYGVGRAIAQPSMLAMVSVAAPPGERGLVIGTYQSSSHLARVGAPMLAGALYDVGITYPFYLASGLMAVALLLALALPAPAPMESGS